MNGIRRSPTDAMGTELTFDVAAGDLSTGTALIRVVNPGPGGGTSNPIKLHLIAFVRSENVLTVGEAMVGVRNPTSRLTSSPVKFSIIPPPPNPPPVIATLSPSTIGVNSDGFTLPVSGIIEPTGNRITLTGTGANFVSGTTAQWNGKNCPTTLVSTSKLLAAIPVDDLRSPG